MHSYQGSGEERKLPLGDADSGRQPDAMDWDFLDPQYQDDLPEAEDFWAETGVDWLDEE